jgi:periplasmic protein TonB
LPAAPGKSGGAASGKRRLMVLVAAAVVLVAVFAFLMLRSNHTQTLQPGEEKQQAPAASTAPPQGQEPAPAASTATPQTQEATPAPPKAQEPAATTPAPSTSVPSGGALNGAVVEQVLPDVPSSASRTIHGTINVRIRVAVDAGGAVTNATADSEGPSKYFANLALKAAQGWKFKPAQADGQAVPSEWILQFRFTQSGAEVTPVEAAR